MCFLPSGGHRCKIVIDELFYVMNLLWSREETIIAFNVYCKIPFRKSSKTHPLILKYAQLLGRSPSALNMKIGNFGRLDPDLQVQGIKGLIHGSKMEVEIWEEFRGNPELLAYESEKLIAQLSQQKIENSACINTEDLPQGEEREVIIRQRVNQSFFRATVLSAYNFHCCISGVGNVELLDACHIVDWSKDSLNRTNPRNGLCLNSFFHQAYDKHFVGITPDLKIVISDVLIHSTDNEKFKQYLVGLNNTKITQPDKFYPQKELLEIHYNYFRNQ